MSRACPVVVRIIPKGDGFLVKGRKTSVVCKTFEEAWEASLPYIRLEKW